MAQRQVDYFERLYDAEMLDFACHAAFPLTLTTEVVYLLRQKYFPDLDWSAAGELLLSNLCDVVGYDLYAISLPVRSRLLKKLVENEEFGKQRVNDLAVWIADYIKQRLGIEPSGWAKMLGDPSEWTALACLKDDEVTEKIEAQLSKLLAEFDEPEQRKRERFRLAALMESQKDLLAELGMKPFKLDKLQELADRVAQGQPLEPDFVQQVQGIAGVPELKPTKIEYAKIVFPAKVEVEEAETLQPFSFETVAQGWWRLGRNRGQNEAYAYTETLPAGLNLEMVAIPSGKFIMGAPEDEAERNRSEGPQHEVTVPPFFMGKYPVTQAQWRMVAQLPQVERELDPNPAYFTGDDRPVERVSWLDAEEFCLRLSAVAGRKYRLPTEAEWEYACRAGTTTPFHFGNTLSKRVANYDYKRQETTPVGSFAVANAFGLYDMHGNVWEWCLDHWHETYEGAPTDGSAWLDADAVRECRPQYGAAARGTTIRGTVARLTATGSSPTTASSTSVFALSIPPRGLLRSPLRFCPLALLRA